MRFPANLTFQMVSYYQNHVGVFGREPKSRTPTLRGARREHVNNQSKIRKQISPQGTNPRSFPNGGCAVTEFPEGLSQIARWQQQSNDPSISCIVPTIQVPPLTYPRNKYHGRCAVPHDADKHRLSIGQGRLVLDPDPSLLVRSWSMFNLSELWASSFLSIYVFFKSVIPDLKELLEEKESKSNTLHCTWYTASYWTGAEPESSDKTEMEMEMVREPVLMQVTDSCWPCFTSALEVTVAV